VGFWTQNINVETDLYPKMKDRFLVIMGGTNPSTRNASNNSQQIMFTVRSATKPTVDVDIKEFKLINHKFKFPGVVSWQPIKLTFVDKVPVPRALFDGSFEIPIILSWAVPVAVVPLAFTPDTPDCVEPVA